MTETSVSVQVACLFGPVTSLVKEWCFADNVTFKVRRMDTVHLPIGGHTALSALVTKAWPPLHQFRSLKVLVQGGYRELLQFHHHIIFLELLNI